MRTEDAPLATMDRSPLDFKKGWQKMKERTSSQRLHFGHFKAACKSKLNIMTHYMLAEIPFRTGYTLNRWLNSTNVMILKQAGVYDISKLRTIVLFEADFNHNNNFFGRAMMNHTVPRQRISKEQYSIPGKKSIDHALNRRLVFDIARYSKQSLAMTSCDLKSCYDRVAHTPAVLAMHSYGIPKEPMFSMFHAIQHISFTTRTAFGDSSKTFGGLEEGFLHRPQGLGQGNGSGPPVWSAVSSKMFEVLHNKGLVTDLSTPITKELLEIAGFAFVDDSDILAGANKENSPVQTLNNTQQTIDWWEGVSKVTGGGIGTS